MKNVNHNENVTKLIVALGNNSGHLLTAMRIAYRESGEKLLKAVNSAFASASEDELKRRYDVVRQANVRLSKDGTFKLEVLRKERGSYKFMWGKPTLRSSSSSSGSTGNANTGANAAPAMFDSVNSQASQLDNNAIEALISASFDRIPLDRQTAVLATLNNRLRAAREAEKKMKRSAAAKKAAATRKKRNAAKAV